MPQCPTLKGAGRVRCELTIYILCVVQVRYWDLRQPNPAHTQQLPERVYGMDVTHPLLVRTSAFLHPLLLDVT